MKPTAKAILGLAALAVLALIAWRALERPRGPEDAPDPAKRVARGPDRARHPDRTRHPEPNRPSAPEGTYAWSGRNRRASTSAGPGGSTRPVPHERAVRGAADPGTPPAPSPRDPDRGSPRTARTPEPAAPAPRALRPSSGPSTAPSPSPGSVTGTIALPDDARPDEALVTLSSRRDRKDAEEARPDPDGSWRFDSVAPGRYQLVATHPGLASHALEIDVEEGRGSGPYALALKRGAALVVAVRGAYGEPLADEEVSVSADGVQRNETTDHEGRVRIEPLEPGRYTVRWIPDGSRGVVRYATVIPGRDVEVVFDAGGAMEGTVVGPDGTAIEAAIVRLIPEKLDDGFRSHEGETDAEGFYRITGAPEGPYDVTVQVRGRDGYTAKVGSVRIWPGQTERRDLRIEPSTLAGRITRADDGRPLDRTQVQITATPLLTEGEGTRRGRPLFAFANETGKFEFVGIAPGRYELWFAPHAPELRERRTTVDVPYGGTSTPIEIALESRPIGRLRLRVVEPDGSAATGVDFYRLETTERGRSMTTVFAKDLGGGVFEIPLEAGERTVSVTRRGFRTDPPSVRVVVPEGEVVEREVRLVPREEDE